ncbi:MAG: hypothetical protein GVY13_14680 [Alphaproteobacteria bacterium]|jgi:Holliday junction resolvase|nr:hypothetical protein [Alphaproteobacteria bacterium]
MPERKIALVDAIADLRRQLGLAIKNRADDPIKFKAEQIDLELAIEFSDEVEGEAGLKVKVPAVLDLGGGGKAAESSTSTHRLKLVLVPVSDDGNPLEIRDILPSDG